MRRWLPCERRAAATCLLDEELYGSEVPEGELALTGEVHRALGDQAVLPEIAEASFCPRTSSHRPPGVGHIARRRRRRF